MSFNPPLPFDPLNQNDYEPWYDMIDSIVGFVTASTHLASTLRNNRCCFPESLEIIEQISENEIDREVFNITDFPWFFNELINIQEIKSVKNLLQCYVTEDFPLIQFPLSNIMQGEPNTEPRAIKLTDTKDFGDADYGSQKQYPSFPDVVSSALRKLESPSSQESNQSCFFEEYTDSEQTIDSFNLQENYEKMDETILKINSKERLCDIYNFAKPKSSIQKDLFLECNVEEIVILQNDSNSNGPKVGNKEESVSTRDDLINKAEILKYFTIEERADVSKRGSSNASADLTVDFFKPKIVEIIPTPESSYEELNIVDLSSKSDEVKSTQQKMHAAENRNKNETEILDLHSVREREQKINKKLRHKVDKIMEENERKCILINDKLRFENYFDVDQNESDMQKPLISTKHEEKKITNRKKISTKNSKKDAQMIKGVSDKDCVNYISKNIANCLNTRNKIKKQTTGKDSNNPARSQLKERRGTTNILKTSSPTDINIQVNSKLREPKASDQVSVSVDAVKMVNQTKNSLKTNSETKKPIAKRSSVKNRTHLEPLNVFKELDNPPEIKSCLKSGKNNHTNRPKTCVINEDCNLAHKKRLSSSTENANSRILPKLPLVRDTTLKLTAAETVKRASELLKNAKKVFAPTTTMKRQVVSESIRVMSAGNNKR